MPFARSFTCGARVGPKEGEGRNAMWYRGYEGVVTFDEGAGLIHGEVAGSRDVITFQGGSVVELQQAFRDSVDEYLAICSEKGREPDLPLTPGG